MAGRVLGLPADRRVQDQPDRDRGVPDDHWLFAQRHDRHLRPHPRSPRQEPRTDRGDGQRSINQTLSRTLLTAGTTLVVVVILYAMGGARHSRLRVLDARGRRGGNLQLGVHRGPDVAVDDDQVESGSRP